MDLIREETQLIVSGKTFDAKETIKALGGKWDPKRRVWTLPLAMDTEDTRARLGIMSEEEKRRQEERLEGIRLAAIAVAAEVEARQREKLNKKAEKQRATAAAKNLELVKWCLADTSGKYSWVCCEKCEIVDLAKKQTSCRAHAHWDGQSWCSFRINGALYTGN